MIIDDAIIYQWVITPAIRGGFSVVKLSTAATTRLSLGALKLSLNTVSKHLPLQLPFAQTKHGQISIRQLQHSNNGGLGHIELDPATVNKLKKELKRHGVDFALQKPDTKDGKFALYFRGADGDHIAYTLERVIDKLGLAVKTEVIEEQTLSNKSENIEAEASQILDTPDEEINTDNIDIETQGFEHENTLTVSDGQGLKDQRGRSKPGAKTKTVKEHKHRPQKRSEVAKAIREDTEKKAMKLSEKTRLPQIGSKGLSR
ncbi:MAG: DUF3801 domain-containing protein [Arcanobacterium sp.]|nr:DUF3801 domain-containing protein [Arcanobacterium sp.]